MVPRQKSCISQISFVTHIKINQYHSFRSVPRATSQSHESKNKQILQPLSKSSPSIYMTQLRVTTKKPTNPPTIVLSFAVVRGWWSAIVLSFPVVRAWWPAIVLSHLPPKPNFAVQKERFARVYHLPWSGVGGVGPSSVGRTARGRRWPGKCQLPRLSRHRPTKTEEISKQK